MKYFIILVILLGVFLAWPRPENPVAVFYETYEPYAVFHAQIKGDRIETAYVDGPVEEALTNLVRPYNEKTSFVLTQMVDPVPSCVVIEPQHMGDVEYRKIALLHGVETVGLCPITNDEGALTGFISYLNQEEPKDLLVPLQALAEKL